MLKGHIGKILDSSEKEEKYIIIWPNCILNSIFEMPTGGSNLMNLGINLVVFSRKEFCLALNKQLRVSFKILGSKIFRVFQNNEIQFLYPNDGVFPEKVNEGRISKGIQNFSIGRV